MYIPQQLSEASPAAVRLRKRLGIYRARHSDMVPRHLQTHNIQQTNQKREIDQRIIKSQSNKKIDKKSIYENKITTKRSPYDCKTTQDTIYHHMKHELISPQIKSQTDEQKIETPQQQKIKNNAEAVPSKTFSIKTEDEHDFQERDILDEFNLDGVDTKKLREFMDDLPMNFMDTFDFEDKQVIDTKENREVSEYVEYPDIMNFKNEEAINCNTALLTSNHLQNKKIGEKTVQIVKETEEVKNLGVEVLDDTNNTSNLVSSSVYDTFTSEALVCDSSRLGISGVGGYDTYRQYGYQGQGGVAPGQMYPNATRYTQDNMKS